MIHKHRWKVGSTVTATSFKGQEIIGIYNGPCESFGVYIHGRPVGSQDDLILIKCMKLTLAYTQPEKTKKGSPGRPGKDLPNIVPRHPCSGLTRQKQRAIGTYFGAAEYPYAWIHGTIAATGEYGTHKVLRSSICLI